MTGGWWVLDEMECAWPLSWSLSVCVAADRVFRCVSVLVPCHLALCESVE